MLARQSLLWVFHLLPSGPQGCVSEARRNTEAAATAHRPAPHQDFSNKLHGTLRHMRPVLLLKRETARLDLVEQLVLVVARERRVAAQQDVEDDAQAPAVHGSIVRLALKDLGGDVPVGHKGAGARSHTHKVVSGRPLSVAQLAGDNPPWRAACGVQRATRFVDVLRKPEVRNLTHHSVTHVSTRPSHAHTPNTVHHTPSAQRRHGLSTAGCSQAVAETPGGNVRQVGYQTGAYQARNTTAFAVEQLELAACFGLVQHPPSSPGGRRCGGGSTPWRQRACARRPWPLPRSKTPGVGTPCHINPQPHG